MTSLAKCIKKAGKALKAHDRIAIEANYNALLEGGMDEATAAQRAVRTRITLLEQERADVVRRIEDAGGTVPERFALAKGRTHVEVARGISSMSLLDGSETLEIPDAKVTKAGKMKATGAQLAKALVDRTLKANRGKPLTARTPRTREILSEALALETEAAINRSGHAGDWYSTVLQNAVNIVGELHPELKTDPNARAAFMVGLAITSNGLDVGTNARAAEEVYTAFKKKGKFPTKGYGDKGPAMTQAFEQANELIDEMGLSNFVKFLNTEFTVGELRTMGFQISGESVDHKTHGSIIFGPKIGGGFYQNLMGNYSPLTMDRWWMRTWGRLTGELLPTPGALPEAQVERLTNAMRENPDVVAEMGYDLQETLNDDTKLVEFATAVHRRYARSGFKEKTELNMAGKNLDIALNAPIIAPGGAEARNWMREIAGLALKKLEQRGYNINAASMQALVWYPEKDLYLQYGATSAKGEPTDYEQELAKLAAERGVPQSRIEAARTGDSSERPAGPVGSDTEGDGGLQAAASRFEGAERKRLIQRAVTLGARQQFPRPFRRSVSKGPRSAVVKAEFKPELKVRNAYERAGLSAPTMYELPGGRASAEIYHKHITEAKVGKDSAAVHVYSPEEYEDMRMFLTEDMKAGFALKGDDIVSLFKHPDSKDKGVAQALLGLAVQEGGRRLDAFDTVLPAMYSMQGFKVVSRLPWADSEAPSDWSKKHFSDFNDGEPDVVFMVYDRSHTATYGGRSEGELFEDYGDAVAAQDAAVAALHERNKPRSVNLSIPKDIKDRVDRNPEGPLSRYHKLGATMEDQRQNGVSSLPLDKLKQIMSDFGVSTTLAAVPRRNLADFIPEEHVPSVTKYIREANRMSGRRNELLQKYEETARKWSKWTGKNKRIAGRLSELMHAATLAGVDPSIPYKPLKSGQLTPEERQFEALRKEQHILLQPYWAEVGETGQEIYREVRDTYMAMRRDIEAGLMARIEQSAADGATKKALMDQLRQQFEAGRVAGPYFPLMRYGQLWAVAKQGDEVVSFSRFENRKEQKAWVKEFKEAGYETDQGRRSQEDGELVAKISPEFASRVTQMAKNAGDDTLADEIWQLYLRNLPEMSMRKRFLHRKGRLGFAADALRAYANVTFRGAHQQAKLEHAHLMQGHLDSLRDEVRAVESNPDLEKEFAWATPLYDEMVRRHKLTLTPSANPISVGITSAGFLWWLGMTPAAAAVNLTQTPLVALPVLAGEFNVLGATNELSKAAGLFAGSRGRIENRLRGDEYRAFEEARRIGLFEKTQAHDLAGVTETGAEGYGSPWHKTVEIGSFLFHKAEQMNREVTFLAAYRLARKKGMSHADAVLKAEDLTWDSHFDYNNENRPRWMQGNMMRVLTLFKQYSLNMTYRMARDFNDSLRGETKEVKKAARTRFGGMMMMAWMLSGLQGLPAIASQGVPWILEAIFGDEDDPWDATDAFRAYLSDLYGPEMAEAIMKGPWDAITGMTLSSRVSLSQLWWRDPSVYDDDEAAFTHIVMEMLGPVPTTVKGVLVDAPRAVAEGHPERGLEVATPKIVRDIVRAYRFSTEGAETWHSPPSVIKPAEDFSALELFYQAFGFTPASLTQQYEQNNAIKNVQLQLQERRQHIIDSYMVAMFNGDKKAIEEANQAIAKWNRTNPGLAIGAGALNRGALTRYERAVRSRGGLTLPDNMMYLYDELNFTKGERAETEE